MEYIYYIQQYYAASNTTILLAVIGALQGVSVAIIVGLFNRDARKRKLESERIEKRARLRAEEGTLSMKLMNACTSLSMATALAVKDGKANGKMSMAIQEAQLAQNDYYKFINAIAKEHLIREA